MAQIVADKQSTAVDTKALDQRLAALFDDTTRQVTYTTRKTLGFHRL